jgi:predicted ATPase/DNA-binding SARP family transcriptional activator
MEKLWRIELFGGLTARSGHTTVSRFYSRKVGALFARLALYAEQAHAREELAERFWPDARPEAGRLNLRAGLASLRRQFEPPGTTAGSILIADRDTVRLNPERVTVDVAEFDAALLAAGRASDLQKRILLLERGVELYRGALLPGYFDDWILAERQRLADAGTDALQRLSCAYKEVGDLRLALEYAHRSLRLDPLREETHCDLIRIYLAIGQPASAQRQYCDLERLLREELGQPPSEATQALAQQATQQLRAEEALLQSQTRQTLPARTMVPALPAIPGPLATPAGASCGIGLPPIFTRFFGRENELQRLEQLLSPQGLQSCKNVKGGRPVAPREIITLTGIGGAGKTRLAFEVGARLREVYHESLYFVSLIDATDPDQLTGAILTALPRSASHEREPYEQILETLRAKPTLLILDNFELLLADEARGAESAALVQRLCGAAPGLTCLITSRQALNIEGEREFPLAPLTTPAQSGTAEQLLEYASVQLFVDRAQRARPDFQITPRNADVIGALCRRLDGIPLALELAAAWARVGTPAQMLERLSDRFEMLVSRRRDIPPRHRSLRAAIDWSYDLLSPELRRFLAQLSIFRGGWTAEAAAAVCAEPQAQDRLLSLCERSLIVSGDEDGSREGREEREEIRFQMLESLREYAREQLAALSVHEGDALSARHAGYFGALAREACCHFPLPDAGAWMDHLEREYDNLQGALEWAFTQDNCDLAIQMVLDLDWFWFTRGHRHERPRWGRRLIASLDRCGGEILPRALLWSIHFYDRAEARRICERCMELFRQLGDLGGMADALYRLAELAKAERDYARAQALFQESLRLHRIANNSLGINAARAGLAHLHEIQGDFAIAQGLLEEQLAAQYEQGNLGGAAKVQIALANMRWRQGEHEAARTLLERSVAIFRQIGQRWGLADALRNLGNVHCSLGEYPVAEELLKTSLEMFRALNNLDMTGYLLVNLGELAMAQRDLEQANALSIEALALIRQANHDNSLIGALHLRGSVLIAQGQTTAALNLLTESLDFARAANNRYAVAWSLYYLGQAYRLLQGDDMRAQACLQEALQPALELDLKPLLQLLATPPI